MGLSPAPTQIAFWTKNKKREIKYYSIAIYSDRQYFSQSLDLRALDNPDIPAFWTWDNMPVIYYGPSILYTNVPSSESDSCLTIEILLHAGWKPLKHTRHWRGSAIIYCNQLLQIAYWSHQFKCAQSLQKASD